MRFHLKTDILLRRLTQIVFAVTVLPGVAPGQRPIPADTARRVLVEAFRVTDPSSSRAAVLLRSQLAQRLRGTGAQVVSNAQLHAIMSTGIDDRGQPWPWSDVREFAKVVRAGIVIDLIVQPTANQVTLASYRLMTKSGLIDTLPPITVQTIELAVERLAAKLATDTSLNPRRP